MANEAQASANLRFSKNGVDITVNVTKQTPVTGNQCVRKTQTIGTGAKEALDLGDIGTPGWIIGINRNTLATDYIELYPDGTNPGMVRAYGGEPFGPFRLSADAATPNAKAFGNACLLEYFVIED